VKKTRHDVEVNAWVTVIKIVSVVSLVFNVASTVGIQPAVADDSSDSFTYQGRFLTADGSASLTDTVNVTFGIYDPQGACLLYEESQAGINLASTDGLFAVNVGSAVGDSKRTASDPGKNMRTVFSNAGTQIVPASATCTGGYTPASGDGRLFRVTVASQTTGVTTTLSPDLVISSVPMAKVAETLQGLTPSQLIQVQGSVSQASVAGLVGGADASTLHNHDSLYVKLGQSISVPAGGTIGLGSFDNSQQTSLIGALGLGDKGKIWMNSDDNKLYYWNGGSAVALSQTASTVSGVTATAPLGSTGGTSPTISISQAGFGSNGYLSSTDWNTFNNKLTSSLSSGLIFVGNGPGVASAVSVSGDATLSSSGVLTLGASGVTAGTYTKLTVDAKGRATVGASLSSADVTGALGFTPANNSNAVPVLQEHLRSAPPEERLQPSASLQQTQPRRVRSPRLTGIHSMAN